ncbi:MAG TPA: PspA/IM30 family protein [Ktedonobacteraceae bacterium]|nr:PspA/IM30 family protein [Ktedonobacteraceae bacterium]
METLRQKARVLSLAWLHQVADAAIDTHSIPVVQQHIRDLEQAISELREAQAQNAGSIAGLNRQISQLHQQESILNTQADALLQLQPPREDLAATVEQRLEEVENNLTPLNNQLEKSQAIQAQYEQAMSALDAKHNAMMNQLRTLQSLDTSATAEDRAAQALHAVSSALGGTASIDDITARIQGRSDVAHARLQQEMGAFTPQPDPVADVLAQSAMQQRLAARKARLNLPPGKTNVTELPPQ